MKNDVEKQKKPAATTEEVAVKSDEARHDTPKLKSKRPVWYGIASLAVVVAVSMAWLACSVYGSTLSIGDMKIPARHSDAAVASLLNRQAAAYRLTINYPYRQPKRFSLQQLGLRLDTTASVQATRATEHKLMDRLRWWRPVPAVPVLSENVDVLNNFIAANINITVQPSKDAQLTITKGVIRLTDATAGKEYGLKQPKQTILNTARYLKPGRITLQTLQINPALTASQLEPYKAELTKTINQPASFTIGSQVIKPSPAQIASWLDITPNDKSKNISITVNSGKVAAYINAIADDAVRPARDQIDITHADGGVQVLVPGADGVSIVDEAGVSTTVAKNLLSGKGFNLTLPVSSQPYKVVKTGSYPKWIEVDLTNKVLYAYQYNTLIKTYLVSAGAPATPTVTGQYKIYAKYLEQNMSGANVDGSSYYQPDVQWVNYFYSDYAIHGNYWRPLSYFGHVNSSHGCVGLLNVNAEWIYNWAPIGTPVVIHT